MLRELLDIELLKVRRSLALPVMLAIALLVVAFNMMLMLRQNDLTALDGGAWRGYWTALSAQWCHFILPLYAALVTGMLNGIEHRSHAWRLMLALPVRQGQLYIAKALVAWGVLVAATLAMMGVATGAALLAGALGAAIDGVWSGLPWSVPGKVALWALPLVAAGHAISWRCPSMAAPLAAGLVATIAISVGGASAHWLWQSWSMAAAAALAGMALLGAGAALLARREVTA